MAFDAHKNFAYTTVLTAPSPASSGTSLVVATGGGALFPAAPFNAVVWPAGAQPLASNAEIIRVTNIAGDTLTITRTQESSTARSILASDQIAAAITAKLLTDIEGSDPLALVHGLSWAPAPYIGTYDGGVSYAYADAVRVWVPAQSKILHITQNADGGTFDLYFQTTIIAWNADQAAIQAALDVVLGAGVAVVVGNAADFTVETPTNMGVAMDGGSLTLTASTPTVTQVTIQDAALAGWHLYISLANGNVGHTPLTDAGVHWLRPTTPVFVQGLSNPNTGGEANRITHFTQSGTGGTFDLVQSAGTASAIAWNAVQATIQAALDIAIGTDKTIVAGDAADFTVEYYLDETAITMDGTNLTGGGVTGQSDSQTLVRGGFETDATGSQYIESEAIGQPHIWFYHMHNARWVHMIDLDMNSGRNHDQDLKTLVGKGGTGNGNIQGERHLTRSGPGSGGAYGHTTVQRSDSGSGDAAAYIDVERSGSGAGNASAWLSAKVSDTAVGLADARSTANHHAGGMMVMGPSADGAGAYAEITGTLPTTDPMVSGHIWEFAGDITALTNYLAGGGKLLVRSP